MALKLKGSTSGFVAIDAPSVAGNNTLILPENTGSAHQILANDITAGVTTFTQVTVSRNGDLTVPGTISIGGTLTYEDVTSVDSVGIVTARGLSIFGNTTGLNVASGISTFQAITGTTGTLSGNLNLADSIIHSGDTNTKIRFPSADTVSVETAGSERLRINSGGKVLINTTTASTVGNSQYSFFEVCGNTSGGTGAGHFTLKRGETSASLSDGDTISRIVFSSLDGGDFAYIQSSVDGSPSGSDFPASLRFHTCADGANTSTERMRIASNGFIGMGGATSPEEVLDLGNDVQMNLKVGGRGYLGQGYSTAATILGHSVKAKTTGTVSGGMEVTETNSGGGAPVAVRMVQGTFQVHTAASGTSGATFDSERFRIDSSGRVIINNTSNTNANTQSDDLIVGNTSHGHDTGITIVSNPSYSGWLAFSDGTSASDQRKASIVYQHSSDALFLRNNGNQNRLTINADGNSQFAGIVTATSFESTTFSKTPTNTPAFHAWSNNVTSHAISDSTVTKVTFLNSETFDTDSAFDNSTSGTTASRFTVPAGKGGYYQISAGLNFFANANDMRHCRVIVKQNTDVKLTSYNIVAGSSDGDIRHFQANISGILQLAAGDYIELFGYLDTNGNSQGYISNDANGYRGNHFSAYKLII